jgi:prevent-host-death family protein
MTAEELPIRRLRNEVSAVVRAAEAGARYVVTVDGRPVAELGPTHRRRWVDRSQVDRLLASPTDAAWGDDLSTGVVDVSSDPFDEASHDG